MIIPNHKGICPKITNSDVFPIILAMTYKGLNDLRIEIVALFRSTLNIVLSITGVIIVPMIKINTQK